MRLPPKKKSVVSSYDLMIDRAVEALELMCSVEDDPASKREAFLRAQKRMNVIFSRELRS